MCKGDGEIMKRKRLIVAGKFAAVLSVPVMLWAYAAGPDAHRTGVPGTNEKNCSDVGCHLGTGVNAGGGNVALTSSAGSNYTPGQKQTLTIRITDSAARVYGFQASARLSSDHSKQAGTFTTGARQFVLCAGTNINDLGNNRPASGTCGASVPLEFIEHVSPFTTNTISFDWTPPSAAAGDIVIYVSANAANGNGAETGDHIYTTNLTLTPGTGGGGPKPVSSTDGVINASQFGGGTGVAPQTFIEIYGSNLATNTRLWAGSDFANGIAPTSLDGTKVTIAGKDAFVNFISPGQVNVQVPDGIGTGPVPLVITSNGVASDPVTVTATATKPGLLAPPAFKVGNTQYVAAFFPDATIVGDPAKIPGTSRPAKPGEIIILYGIGFGPVSPNQPAGKLVTVGNAMSSTLGMRLGQIGVSRIDYKGLSPSFVGLYQFNWQVPANAPNGDLALEMTIDGSPIPQTLFLPVKQ